MTVDEIKDYDYDFHEYEFAKMLDVEQLQNKNGSVSTFYNINEGCSIEGVDTIGENKLKTYTCRNNDDLRMISYDLYGSMYLWWLLAKLNGFDDCMIKLKAGQKIKYVPKYVMRIIYDKIKEGFSS